MVAWWWYTFGHAGTLEWTFGTYLLLLPFPVLVYLQCVILYPHRFEDVHDLGAYFMATRKWFFALVLVTMAFVTLVLGVWQIFDDHPTLGAVSF